MSKREKIQCMKQLYEQLSSEQKKSVYSAASRLQGAKFAKSETINKIPNK